MMDGSGFARAFDGFVRLFVICAALAVFGVWKLIEIAIWLLRHVEISWS